jgi:hypothetical protein
VENHVDLSGVLEMFRVQRDLVLCGFLNRDVGTLVLLNFGCKSCVSMCSTCFTFKLFLLFLVLIVFLL